MGSTLARTYDAMRNMNEETKPNPDIVLVSEEL
jgi:hypothetical protein